MSRVISGSRPPLPPAGESPRIAVFGDATLDMLARLPAVPEEDRDEKVLSEFFTTYLGGTGLNTAAAAQRLGVDALFFTGLGDDFGGAWVQEELDRVGLLHHEVIVQPGRTPIAIIVIRGEEREMIINLGPPLAMTPVSDPELLASVDACFVIQSLSSLEYLLESGLGEKTILGVEDWMAELPNLPDLVNRCRLGVTNEKAMRAVRRAFPQAAFSVPLVETRGSRGSVIHDPSGVEVAVPVYPVTAVDATGAGDTFAAALVSELVSGRDLLAAARLASVAAALSTQQLGSRAKLPALEELRERAAAFYGVTG